MTWKVFLAGAVGAAALAGAANAGTVDIAAYNGYDDNGAGMTFSGPPVATGSINSPAGGFFYDWNAPGSVGGFNANDVFSADFKGVLDVASAGTYSVTFGSDDAGYLFINGALAVSDGGAHGYNPAVYNIALNAGANTFEIQYGNVFCCGAAVGLTAGAGVAVGSIPEPSTWAVIMLGLFGTGALLRTRRQQAMLA